MVPRGVSWHIHRHWHKSLLFRSGEELLPSEYFREAEGCVCSSYLLKRGIYFVLARFIFLQQYKRLLCTELTLCYYFRDIVHSLKCICCRLCNFTSTGISRSTCVKSSVCLYAFLYRHQSARLCSALRVGYPGQTAHVWSYSMVLSSDNHHSFWLILHLSVTAYKFHLLFCLENWEFLLK